MRIIWSSDENDLLLTEGLLLEMLSGIEIPDDHFTFCICTDEIFIVAVHEDTRDRGGMMTWEGFLERTRLHVYFDYAAIIETKHTEITAFRHENGCDLAVLFWKKKCIKTLF